jgi:hypothetical protein
MSKEVGRVVRVFWPNENDWFRGKIDNYTEEKGYHTIVYVYNSSSRSTYFICVSVRRLNLLAADRK